MSESDDFFGGSSKSASFAGQPGISWGGIIDRIGSKVQKREYSPNGELGALKFYPGTQDPIWQLPVTILTDARDPSVPNDDGRRTIYFEGAKRKALIEALKAAGLRGPVLGDWMSLTYYADEAGRGTQPKKLYRAEYAVNPDQSKRGAGYQAPDAALAAQSDGFFGGGQQQAQQAQFQPPAPVRNAGPFQAADPATSPANNWPPNGAAAAAQAQPDFSQTAHQSAPNGNGWPAAQNSGAQPGAAPANTVAQAEPVAAGAGGPVAQGRPWG